MFHGVRSRGHLQRRDGHVQVQRHRRRCARSRSTRTVDHRLDRAGSSSPNEVPPPTCRTPTTSLRLLAAADDGRRRGAHLQRGRDLRRLVGGNAGNRRNVAHVTGSRPIRRAARRACTCRKRAPSRTALRPIGHLRPLHGGRQPDGYFGQTVDDLRLTVTKQVTIAPRPAGFPQRNIDNFELSDRERRRAWAVSAG